MAEHVPNQAACKAFTARDGAAPIVGHSAFHRGGFEGFNWAAGKTDCTQLGDWRMFCILEKLSAKKTKTCR